MANLLMISGRGAGVAARGEQGAFFQTLTELRQYWSRIDILAPAIGDLPPITRLFDNVYIHISPESIWRQPWWLAKYGSELHAQNHYAVAVVQEYPPFYNGWGAYLLNKRNNLPYILQFHHIPGYPRAADLKEVLQRWFTRLFASLDSRRAKAIQVVNQKQTPDFLAQAGVSRPKMIYIPSMYIDLDIFKPLPTVKRYDCILVARLVLNKGLDLFIAALARTQLTACIVGVGPELKAIETRLKVLGLTQRVNLYGWARDAHEIAALMREAEMLVVASYNEGGPRVALEAMSCGVPVVTTHVGLMEDLGRDRETVVFADWTPESLANALELVHNDQELRVRLANVGPKIAARFERKAMIANFANELKRLSQ